MSICACFLFCSISACVTCFVLVLVVLPVSCSLALLVWCLVPSFLPFIPGDHGQSHLPGAELRGLFCVFLSLLSCLFVCLFFVFCLFVCLFVCLFLSCLLQHTTRNTASTHHISQVSKTRFYKEAPLKQAPDRLCHCLSRRLSTSRARSCCGGLRSVLRSWLVKSCRDKVSE